MMSSEIRIKPSLVSLLEMAAVAAKSSPYLVFPIGPMDVKPWVVPEKINGNVLEFNRIPTVTGEQASKYLFDHLENIKSLPDNLDEYAKYYMAHLIFVLTKERQTDASVIEELKKKHEKEIADLNLKLKDREEMAEFWKVRFGDMCK